MSGHCGHWDMVFGFTFICGSVFDREGCLPVFYKYEQAIVSHNIPNDSTAGESSTTLTHKEYVKVFGADCRLLIGLGCSVVLMWKIEISCLSLDHHVFEDERTSIERPKRSQSTVSHAS